MKIAHLIDAQGGGALTHIFTLCRNLSHNKAEMEVIFFIPGPGQKIAAQLDITSHLIKKKFSLDLALAVKLAQFLKKNKFNLIHTHTINSNFYGRLAGFIARIPVVTTVHSYMIDELSGLETNTRMALLMFRVDMLMSKMTKRFIAVSDGIKRRILEQGVSPSKIDIIKHGIDLPPGKTGSGNLTLKKKLRLKENDMTVAIVGRLVPVKNHQMFLMAAKIVLREIQDLKFVIIGDGILKKKLQLFCAELGIADKVIFAGWRNDMDAIYKLIDILVLCSTTESQGLVLLEAMAHKQAVIATDIDEISKTVIHEQTGLLVPSGDEMALAESIIRLLEKPNFRKCLSESGYEMVKQNFSVQKMINKIVDCYGLVLQT